MEPDEAAEAPPPGRPVLPGRRWRRRLFASIPVAALIIWALVVYGSYRYAERVFLVLSLAFLAYPIAAVLARQAQVLNGVITPILLSYVLVLANRRTLLGEAAYGRAFRITATICVAVIAVMAAAVLGPTIAGWFGISYRI